MKKVDRRSLNRRLTGNQAYRASSANLPSPASRRPARQLSCCRYVARLRLAISTAALSRRSGFMLYGTEERSPEESLASLEWGS